MTGLQFVVGLIGALAWPTVVLILVLMFRGPILQAVSDQGAGRSLKRAKVGPVEIEWETLDQARTEVATAGTPGSISHLPIVSSHLGDVLPLVETHPTAAVMISFQKVEAALAQALHARNIPTDGIRTVGRLVETAQREGVVSPNLASALDGLRRIRNQVAHALDPEDAGVTPARAIEYVTTSEEIINALSRTSNHVVPEPR